MARRKEPEFIWDEESGIATCILTDGNNTFLGVAQCCEDDRDMLSEKTGCTIAFARAKIKYYIHMRDNEIKPALKVLNHVCSTMNRSKHFNSKSYENRMIWRQIHEKEEDLALINDMIIDEKQNLKTMLEEKDKFYQRVRANREKMRPDHVGQN